MNIDLILLKLLVKDQTSDIFSAYVGIILLVYSNHNYYMGSKRKWGVINRYSYLKWWDVWEKGDNLSYKKCKM